MLSAQQSADILERRMSELADAFAETLVEVDERAWTQLLVYCPKRALFKAPIVKKRVGT